MHTQTAIHSATAALTLLLAPFARGADRYAGLDSAKYLSAPTVEATVAGEKPFTEGPAVDAQGNVFFTNTGEILKFSPETKELAVFRKPSNGANGSCFDSAGRLVNCEAGDGANGRVTRTNFKSGAIEV